MLLNRLHIIPYKGRAYVAQGLRRISVTNQIRAQQEKAHETCPVNIDRNDHESVGITPSSLNELLPIGTRVLSTPVVDQPVALSFDDVPGPKSLRYFSTIRLYLSEIGTQITANILTIGLNIGTLVRNRKPLKNLSTLFDEYGPVVRFVSPVGGDIVLLNHPDHIQKVYSMEGEYPVRSTLDSLEQYRQRNKAHVYRGLYSLRISDSASQGNEWNRQRMALTLPLHNAATQHVTGISEICDTFTQKIYGMRNYQDVVDKDLYKEIHKWAFDCLGLVTFSKKFTMLESDIIYNQCDMTWLYHCLEKATDAIIKCESGLQLWKLFDTPAWHNLVKYCDSVDNLIGKYVIDCEQKLYFKDPHESIMHQDTSSMINSMLNSDEKMSPEDITTVLMDMLLIGVNTVTSSMAFLMYFLAKHQKAQSRLYAELEHLSSDIATQDLSNLKDATPYLQACIKETLRLVPPIPLLTRILPKNITLDKYNIPRGTLIMMSTQDTSIKESNYDNASVFFPERWLSDEAKDYHGFASIPFGYGSRKCLGQNIAETMLSLLTIKLLHKYKMEYHYGDITPTRSFIAKPNKKLKIRFIDRM